MKAVILAALIAVLLVSACVRPPHVSTDQPVGDLGVAEPTSGLGDLPREGSSEDAGLTGQQVDLGPIV
jgi:hypothetical protein